jgi:bifunctional UDP-N-acetylglucosamine pyrophosphorylase/glucosamine-1-phosphate N-acetyltransferase
MRSRRHKVLHPLAGKPLITRVLDLLTGAGAERLVVVLGHHADQVRGCLPPSVLTVHQEPQLGTGHALQVAAPKLKQLGLDRVLVHYGDAALVLSSSLRRLVQLPLGPTTPIGLLTAQVADPRGYGRVVRGADGTVSAMVEEVEANANERAVNEIWGGSMLLWTEWLWRRLADLPRRSNGEYYLPDLVNLARAEGLSAATASTDDEDEVRGVNDRAQLGQANEVVRRRTIGALLERGVTILDPTTTYVEPEVAIEPDVVVQPGCHLTGRTTIAAGCEIGPNTHLIDTEIGADSHVWWSVLESARVGRGVSIGPFTHLRPGADIEDGVQLGNYAEVKASRVGAGTQMHHFSYVGDADVGAGVNVAAGTITCNYDAETRSKSRTVIEDGVALGSDTLLVAPVRVGANAMTGAGAIVTHDIPAEELWRGVPARFARKRHAGSAEDEVRGPVPADSDER